MQLPPERFTRGRASGKRGPLPALPLPVRSATTEMDFRLLGPLEVAHEGRVLALGPPKQRSLLALLLIGANEVVPVERLIDELWGESPPATAGKSVHVY